MERHRIGLIGCGAWGRHILRGLLSLGCEVAVVARSEANRRHAAEAGAAAVVGSVGELPPVEGVVVATPNNTHAAVVEAVLPLGVPVFVEKPFTVDAAAAERRRRVTLHCRDGVAVLADGYADHVTVLRHRDLAGPEAAEERRPISTELPLYRELATFVQHLEGGPPPRSSAAEGAAVVRTIAVLRALAGLPNDGGRRP